MRWSRLYPRAWRDRYGAEVDELLVRSGRPWRDRAGVVIAAAGQHVERMAAMSRSLSTNARRLLVGAAAAYGVLGAMGVLWSARRLTDGVPEIPMHWWSVLAVVPPLAAAGVLGAVVAVGRRRPGRSVVAP